MAKRMALKLIPLIPMMKRVPMVQEVKAMLYGCENHYFYVLRCNDQSFYGGYTTDLSRLIRGTTKGSEQNIPVLLVTRPLQMIMREAFYSQ